MKAVEIKKIPIYVMGKKFEVPEELTILKALEYSGFDIKRGCGCRGGVCGACATVYRRKGEYKINTGLACQTVIEPEINLVQLPFVSTRKSLIAIREVEPESLDIVKAYPELMRCMGCNTCTKSCPVDLKVMDYVSAVIRGDLAEVVELSIDCVMCGMCASRCPAELTPFNIALFVRRVYGMHMLPESEQLISRLQEIEDGIYTEELTKLKTMPNDDMQARFLELQANKGASI